MGKSYNPEFYQFIKNSKARKVIERIAEETEEDYQKLTALLESFDVKVLRPTVSNNYKDHIDQLDPKKRILAPPMTPRDFSAMIGDTFYFKYFYNEINNQQRWDEIRGSSWNETAPTSLDQLNQFVLDELATTFSDFKFYQYTSQYNDIIDHVKQQNNTVVSKVIRGATYEMGINSAMISRIGRDLYFGTELPGIDTADLQRNCQQNFPDYRCHVVDTQGHSDGTYCPVKPGLIISLEDIPTYQDTFPGWEVVYLPHQSWDKVRPFLGLKEKNAGKWWVPGEELNDDFTDFVESWLGHWVGYVEETVFDVNMLVIDEHNVICNNYNKTVFDAFERHNITPHICNFRHRYFWDGGLHCITSDLHREGIRQDYFPGRE